MCTKCVQEREVVEGFVKMAFCEGVQSATSFCAGRMQYCRANVLARVKRRGEWIFEMLLLRRSVVESDPNERGRCAK